jgi:hypothetical protein
MRMKSRLKRCGTLFTTRSPDSYTAESAKAMTMSLAAGLGYAVSFFDTVDEKPSFPGAKDPWRLLT